MGSVSSQFADFTIRRSSPFSTNAMYHSVEFGVTTEVSWNVLHINLCIVVVAVEGRQWLDGSPCIVIAVVFRLIGAEVLVRPFQSAGQTEVNGM